MDKYWPAHPHVIICGFSAPSWELPERFSWHSIGPFENYPFKKWSNAIIKLFSEDFNDGTFCLMLEDYWITRPVYDRKVLILHDYMNRHPSIIKVDLGTDRRFAKGVTDLEVYQNLPIIKSDRNSPYQMSLMCGLWRRKAFLDVLIPDESPHDVEIYGTSRLAKMDYDVIGTSSWISDQNVMPIHHTLGQRGGDHSVYYFDELSEEDKSIVEGML